MTTNKGPKHDARTHARRCREARRVAARARLVRGLELPAASTPESPELGAAELLTSVDGGPLKDVQCAVSCPAGTVVGWAVGPGVRIFGLPGPTADALAAAIVAAHGLGAAMALRSPPVRSIAFTDDGATLQVAPGVFHDVRGALAAWLAYPLSARAIACTVKVSGGDAVIWLTTAELEDLELPAEPMEARTLLLSVGDAPEGFTV